MLHHTPNPIERAFEIANEGRCRRVSEVVEQLKREGYENVHSHLGGMSIKRQLTAALKHLDL